MSSGLAGLAAARTVDVVEAFMAANSSGVMPTTARTVTDPYLFGILFGCYP
jgi:hypothetical protein